MLPTKFQVSWPFGSEEVKSRSHLGFRIGTILATFDLQFTPMLPTKFPVNWPFGSGEEGKIDFSRQWSSSDQNDFRYF